MIIKKHVSVSRLKIGTLLAVAVMGVTILPAPTIGDVYTKAPNNTNLNVAGSWVNNAIPGTGDLLLWDSNATAAGNTASMGGNLSVLGVQLTTPTGAVTINTGGTLTIGASGIDLSAATQNLTVNAVSILSANQSWAVASGRTLIVAGNDSTGSNTITKTGLGNATVSGIISGSTILTNNGGGLYFNSTHQTFTGTMVLNTGVTWINFNNVGTDTDMLNSGVNLVLAGGTLTPNTTSVATGNNTQNFVNAVSLLAGESVIAPARSGSGSNIMLNLSGGITRSVGSTLAGEFNNANTHLRVTTTDTASGIIGGWFVVSSTTGATNISTWARFASGNDVTNAVTYSANAFAANTQNTDVTAGFTATAAATTGSVRFNTAASTTLSLNGANVIGSGGILVTQTVGANTTAINNTNGTDTLTSGNGTDLIVNQYNPSSPFTIGATIANNGATPIALTKSGPGTLVLTGTNTYSGQVYVNNGVMQVSNYANLGAAGTGANINLLGGVLSVNGTFNMNNGGAGTNDRNIVLGLKSGTLDVTSGNRLGVSGVISGVGSLTKTSSGSLVLSNANTFTGGMTVSGGALAINNTSGSATGTGPLSLTGTSVLSGTGSTSSLLSLASGTHVAPGNAGIGTLSVANLSMVTGSVLDFEIDATNAINDKINVTGNNGLIINGGSVNFYNGVSLTSFNTVGTYTLMNYAGTLGGVGLNALTVANPAPNTGYIFSTNGSAVVLSVVNGTFSSWLTDADGNWGDGVNWTGGNVPQNINDQATFGNVITTSRNINIDGNKTLSALNFSTGTPGVGYIINSSSGSTMILDNTVGSVTVTDGGGAHTINVPVQLNSVTTFNMSSTTSVLTMNGIISSGGTNNATTNISVIGGGSLVLAAANTYAGNTAIAAASTVVLNQGGFFGTGTVTNGGSIVLNHTDAYTLPNVFAGSGTLTKIGTGTATLTAAGFAAGSVIANAGILQFAPGATLGSLAVGVNGQVDVNGNNLITSALSLTGTLTNAAGSAGSLTLKLPANSTTTFTGVLTNGGNPLNLILSGSGAALGGSLTLNTVNNYTGKTIFSNGTESAGQIIVGVTGAIPAASEIDIVSTNGLRPLSVGSGVTLASPVVIQVTQSTGTSEFIGVNGTGAAGTFSGNVTLLNAVGTASNDIGASAIRIGSGAVTNTLTVTGNISGAATAGANAQGISSTVVNFSNGNLILDGAIVNSFGSQWVIGRTGAQVVNFTMQNGATMSSSVAAGNEGGNLGGTTAVATTSVNATINGSTLGVGLANFNINNGSTTTTTNLTLINGGKLSAGGITKTSTGASTLTLAGGIIEATASNPTFLPNSTGLTFALGSGGGTLSLLNNATIGIQQPLTGIGGLVVTGAGRAVLSGANNFTGDTNVTNNATLGIAGSIGNVTVNSGATLNPTGLGNIGTLTVTNLTLNTGANANFDLSALSGNDLLAASGVLTLGSNPINIGLYDVATGLPYLRNGIFTLFTANSGIPNSATVQSIFGNTVSNPATGATYTFGSNSNSIFVQISGLISVGTWALDNNTPQTWNNTANWTGDLPNSQFAIAQLFGSVTAPTGTGTITLDGDRTVGAINVNNTVAAYEIAQGTGGSLILDNGTQNASVLVTGSLTISAPATLNSTLTLTANPASILAISGNISGALPMTVTGGGTVILAGANTYGTTSIGATGVLQIGNGGTSGSAGAGTITNAGILRVNRSDTYSLGNDLTGAGTLVQAGPGKTVLTSVNNTMTGATTVSAGTLALGTGSSIGTGALTVNGLFDVGGNNVTVSGLSGGGVVDNTTATGVTLTLASGTFSGNINQSGSGVVSITKSTGAALTLSGGGNFTGPININATSLVIASSSAAGNTSGIFINNVTNGLVINDGVNLSRPVTNTGTTFEAISIPANASATLSGNLTATGGQMRLGWSGSLTLTGTVDYQDHNLFVTQGTAIFASNANLTNTAATSTQAFNIGRSAGTTVVILKDNSTATASGVQLAASGSGTNVADTLTIQDNAIGNFGGTLGTSSVNLAATATNTFVNLNGGTLATGSFARAIATGGSTLNLNGGVIRATQTSTTFLPALSVTTVIVGTGGAKFDSQGFAITVAAPLTSAGGDGGLTKLGTGTMVLGAANTYTGPTNVNAGLLSVNGTIASTSAVTVLSSAAIGGTGSIAGPISIADGASLNLVDGAVGTLTLGANLTVGGTSNPSTLRFEVGATPDTVNLGANQLVVNSGGATVALTNLASTPGTFTLMNYASGTNLVGITGGTYALGFNVGTVSVTPTSLQLVVVGNTTPANAYWTGAQGSAWNANNAGLANFNDAISGGNNTAQVPGSISNVIFATTNPVAGSLTTTLGQNFAVNSVQVLSGVGAVSITGANTLTLGSGGISVDNASNGLTISAPVVVNVAETWTGGNTPASSLTLTGLISGTGSLTLAGIVTIGGTVNNTYTGGTTIVGTVYDNRAPSALETAAFGTGALNAGGGTLVLSGTTGATIPTIHMNAGTLTLANTVATNQNTNISNAIDSTSTTARLVIAMNNGSSNFSINNAGIFTGFTGTVAVSGGYLRFVGANVDHGFVNSTVDLSTNGGLRDRDGGTFSIGALTGDSTSIIAGAATTPNATIYSIGTKASSTYTGNILSGTNATTNLLTTTSLIKTGSTTLTLGGTANNYTGTVTVNQGVLEVNSISNGGIAVASAAFTTGANTLVVNTAAGLAVGMAVAGDDIVHGAPGVAGVPRAFISNINGTTLTLTQNATVSNAAITNLLFGAGDPLGLSTNAASNVVIDGGTLRYTGPAASTDRLFTVGTNSGNGSLESSGTGPVNFTNTGSIAFGSTSRTLTLGGSNTGNNILSAAINDGASGTTTSLAKTGVGKWVLSGPITSTGSISVSAGKMVLSHTTAARQSAGVLIETSGLSLTGSAQLDITNHDLLIHNATYASVFAKIASGYNFGLWNGPGILTSEADAAGGTTMLGVLQGSDYDNFNAPVFDGRPVVATDVVVKYTYWGDLTLDGQVNGDDLGNFLNFYDGTGGPGVGNYIDGDMNFDGLINGDDLGNFLNNYTAAPAPAPLGGGFGSLGLAAVPEPASLMLLGLGASALLTRRRRRN